MTEAGGSIYNRTRSFEKCDEWKGCREDGAGSMIRGEKRQRSVPCAKIDRVGASLTPQSLYTSLSSSTPPTPTTHTHARWWWGRFTTVLRARTRAHPVKRRRRRRRRRHHRRWYRLLGGGGSKRPPTSWLAVANGVERRARELALARRRCVASAARARVRGTI